METTEEVLTGILRLVQAAYKNAPEEERVAAAQGELQLQRNNTERQKNARLAKVPIGTPGRSQQCTLK
jgi:hypothetical protein